MKFTYSAAAQVFKAFGDENRIKIILLLKSGEKCGCELLKALNVTQPTLSHHMKILCDANIVEPRREGKWTHYKISDEGREIAMSLLEEITKPL